ncbi:MAG: autoinducer binding domain-containing protein [Rhodospirillaceae bacterium]|nr:autoinducer binding domain-containing protein [Rhodospirillaceae bacterium]
MKISRANGIAEATAGISSPDEIGLILGQYLGGLGFSGFCYAPVGRSTAINPQTAIYGSQGWGPDGSGEFTCWPTHYLLGARYVQDPMVGLVAASYAPLSWSGVGSDPQLDRLRREAARFGVGDAIGLAVRGAHDQCEAIAFAYRPITAAEPLDPAFDYLRVELAVLQTHLKCRTVLEQRARTLPGTVLTSREREVFEWVARGRSNAEIARLLNISERTVNFHIDNTRKKVKARNRMHALVELIIAGEIRPQPLNF